MHLVALGGNDEVFQEALGHVDAGSEVDFALLLIEVDFADLKLVFVELLNVGPGCRRGFRFLSIGSREAKQGGEQQGSAGFR